jgi:putative AbiEii toxin of type IV toxin-antitoxin system
VELLWLEATTSQLLVLIDEPAYSLHPTAQRMVARILSNLSDRHQIIYSTHSPFMVDWSFPQRVRLIERDPRTKRASIINKPYHPTQSYQISWDPVREAIGVSMGDLAVLGDRNLLVEGVSDQILLANASVALVDSGDPHSDLTGISIVPFGDNVTTLARLLDRVDNIGGRALVLTDSDDAGDEIVKYCARRGVPALQVGQYVPGRSHGQDASIEDLVGVDDYLRVINDFYTPFPWFAPLDLSAIPRQGRGLGRFVADAFGQAFAPRRFDKIVVAVTFAETLGEKPGLAKPFSPLLQDVVRIVGGGS